MRHEPRVVRRANSLVISWYWHPSQSIIILKIFLSADAWLFKFVPLRTRTFRLQSVYLPMTLALPKTKNPPTTYIKCFSMDEGKNAKSTSSVSRPKIIPNVARRVPKSITINHWFCAACRPIRIFKVVKKPPGVLALRCKNGIQFQFVLFQLYAKR